MTIRRAFLASLLAAGLFLVVQVAAAAAFQFLDLDGDGLDARAERRVGTDPWSADTDGDALGDGWEHARGLDALRPDTDDDGLDDGDEVARATDPLQMDSDGDGIHDHDEVHVHATDPRKADTDGDRLPDGDERTHGSDPLHPDSDRDGVPDGDESHPTCLLLADCDGDGLQDALERELVWDPLNPDTFGARLPDGIVYAFHQAGQSAGSDADADGIPDPWEEGTGLLDWAPYDPRPGQRDLLVEYVRAVGPHSGQYTGISLSPSYERVRQVFAAQGIVLQHQETVVRLAQEPQPSLIPTRDSAYYNMLLDRARYSANPYVLTVVINPQLDQTLIAHAGVAPIRGMLAAVDLSQYVRLTLRSTDANYSVQVGPFNPWVESLIRDGRLDTTQQQGGINADGSYYLMLGLQGGGATELRWNPYWFQSPRLQHPETGEWIPLHVAERTLEDAQFAHVVLHEMGHSLGLCHPHSPDCLVQLPPAQRPLQAQSTMSYDSAPTTLHFLPAEWERVGTYLACPPPEPIRHLAQGNSRDAVLDAKYAYNLEDLENVSVRACQDFTALPVAFQPLQQAAVYEAPAANQDPPTPRRDATPTLAWWGGAMALGLGLGVAAALVATRR